MYIIPLTSDPDQTFISTISVDDKNLTLMFRLRYNTIASYWFLAIADSKGNVLIDSLPLFTGQNLLQQYRYLNIGSAYLVQNGKTYTENPSENNLGSDFVLLWGDTNG
jgi:hypothetical protein